MAANGRSYNFRITQATESALPSEGDRCSGDCADLNTRHLSQCADCIPNTVEESLDQTAISTLSGFFQILNQWDLEVKKQ